ncbi:benzil reductase ((S)-benzoin forming) [Lutibacter agarilyticus]|uniref:Benzil reductase ((S)-benzoin forming) n=1 Tax=Lutibacter agarilyticus TaxID=1109740 RepID=A0A238WVW7_9FLAO|nr:SDR family NAD(P)-dependent oxidoreductase [Lutibacter agarilyticus]SNR50662.1 benzil reductase ((S)-benzoin forming) [Lutibacter agarilyticus]
MENILIITGGSKGIGLGLAKEYHKNGYRIISISRSKIEKLYSVEQYQCDVTNVEKVEKTLIEIFSQLDNTQTKSITLINNAGNLGTVNTLDNIEPSDINYTLSVNLIAPLVISSQFIKLTKNWKCKKQIFNISSGAAINAYESWAMYCASKAGIDMMTRVLSKEQKELKNGVSVVSIYPGIVDTDMQAQARNTPKENFKSVQRFIDFYEHGELFTPKQVAKKIYKLDISGELKNGRILDVRNI